MDIYMHKLNDLPYYTHCKTLLVLHRLLRDITIIAWSQALVEPTVSKVVGMLFLANDQVWFSSLGRQSTYKQGPVLHDIANEGIINVARDTCFPDPNTCVRPVSIWERLLYLCWYSKFIHWVVVPFLPVLRALDCRADGFIYFCRQALPVEGLTGRLSYCWCLRIKKYLP